eukprot:CAMPEP_0184679646 /NCGR_PEP_ID=MMETSP0312-20130426/2480_1 /TAXON_ID=31354 /ORGANISM="Compsopogon coeruleus, Strain SAG 36.94" /LENGTH=322 /DNA_ID=CAMNT_0027129213 /DNA_START=292 /DNA_END=1260 /DNA_ORIENTATION=-
MTKSVPTKRPPFGERCPLRVGKSLKGGASTSSTSEFVTLNYEFFPTSVDERKGCTLRCDSNKCTVDFSGSHPVSFSGNSIPERTRSEHLLIFTNNTWRLEKVSRICTNLRVSKQDLHNTDGSPGTRTPGPRPAIETPAMNEAKRSIPPRHGSDDSADDAHHDPTHKVTGPSQKRMKSASELPPQGTAGKGLVASKTLPQARSSAQVSSTQRLSGTRRRAGTVRHESSEEEEDDDDDEEDDDDEDDDEDDDDDDDDDGDEGGGGRKVNSTPREDLDHDDEDRHAEAGEDPDEDDDEEGEVESSNADDGESGSESSDDSSCSSE